MADRPEQLVLVQTVDEGWHLDERTRQIGLRGIAEARRVLGGPVSTRRPPRPRHPSGTRAA